MGQLLLRLHSLTDADSLMAQVVQYVPFDRQTSVEMHTRTVRSSIREKKFKNNQKFSKISAKRIKLQEHQLTKYAQCHGY